MAVDVTKTNIYHITDIENLPAIIAAGGLRSDVALAGDDVNPEVIGYAHIKHRRMHETRIPCCGNRFVGEFVPFYYCPRSPMLYTINRGNTGRPAGCQRTILHLVSTVADGIATGRQWAISDGNAGAVYPSFFGDAAALDDLDWDAIGTRLWQGRTNQKSAEFLVADEFPWTSIRLIGCFNDEVAARVRSLLEGQAHRPEVRTMTTWYYS